MCPGRIELTAVPGVPLVRPGDDVGAILVDALRTSGLTPRAHDILVIAQKIISKAEDRIVDLESITPSGHAQELGLQCNKDPRMMELVLQESDEILRTKPGVVIAAHRLGHVMANAGVDRSNVGHGNENVVSLLPRDPDASASALKARLDMEFRVDSGVIISDSFGRAWRMGTTGVAIGVAGLPALLDRVGFKDLFGRPLETTQIAFADEIAAAASLLMGQAAEGVPAVLVHGLDWREPATGSVPLLRPREQDLFR